MAEVKEGKIAFVLVCGCRRNYEHVDISMPLHGDFIDLSPAEALL